MTEEQLQFALKVATLLNDLHSLPMHESFVRMYPRELLEEQLQMVLSRPNIANKGAYYRTVVKSHARARNTGY